MGVKPRQPQSSRGGQSSRFCDDDEDEDESYNRSSRADSRPQQHNNSSSNSNRDRNYSNGDSNKGRQSYRRNNIDDDDDDDDYDRRKNGTRNSNRDSPNSRNKPNNNYDDDEDDRSMNRSSMDDQEDYRGIGGERSSRRAKWEVASNSQSPTKRDKESRNNQDDDYSDPGRGGNAPAALVPPNLSNMRYFLTTPLARNVGVIQCYIKRNKSGTNKLFPIYSLYLKVMKWI